MWWAWQVGMTFRVVALDDASRGGFGLRGGFLMVEQERHATPRTSLF